MITMLVQRLALLVPAALLPLAISFTWAVDALAPKEAAWLLTGAALMVLPGPGSAPWPLAAFLAVAAAGCLRGPVTVLPLAPWLVGALLFVRARAVGRHLGFTRQYLAWTAGIATLVAANGIAQAGWNSIVTGVRLINPFGARILSTLGNPTFLADYLALHLPILMTLALDAGGMAAAGWWGATGLTATAILLSGSKGGQLAALTAVALWLVAAQRRAGRRGARVALPTVAIAGLAFAIVLAVPALRAPLDRWTSGAQRFSFTQRLDMLRGTARLIGTAPLFGHGTGQLPVLFPQTQPATLTRSLGPTLSVNHAHDDWAEVTADLGLIGLVLFLAVLMPGWRNWQEAGPGGALSLSLLAMAVSMGTNFFLYLPSSGFFLWVHAGLAAAPSAGNTTDVPLIPHSARRAIRWLALLLCLKAGSLLVSTAEYHFGAEAVDRGDGITSVGRLQKAVALTPENRHPWQYLGRAYEIRGDLENSLLAYRRALALAPWHAITNLNVGRIDRQSYLGLPLLRHGARDRALDALGRALAASPWMTEPRVWGGELSLDAGRMDLAQHFLGDGPPDVPPTPGWHRVRARWLDATGNARGAALERGRAEDLEGRAVLAGAESALQAGNLGEAARVASDVTRRWPRLAAGWEVLGFVLHAQGQAAGARVAFMHLAQLLPDSITAQLNLATIALNARQPAAAERYLGRAMLIDASHPELHLGLARLRLSQGRREEALGEYRRTLTLAPGHPQAAAELARLEGR